MAPRGCRELGSELINWLCRESATMSDLGHFQTSFLLQLMSALPLEADTPSCPQTSALCKKMHISRLEEGRSRKSFYGNGTGSGRRSASLVAISNARFATSASHPIAVTAQASREVHF